MKKIVFIFQAEGDNMRTLNQAACELKADDAGNPDFAFFDAAAVDQDEEVRRKAGEALSDADFLFMSLHGGVGFFQSIEEVKNICSDRKIMIFLHSGNGSDEEAAVARFSDFPMHFHQVLAAYRFAGGVDNMKNLILYIDRCILGGQSPESLPPPVIENLAGIFGIEATAAEEEACKAKMASIQKMKPVIGILIHAHNVKHGNTAHIEFLMEEIRKAGGEPYPVYAHMAPYPPVYDGLDDTLRRYWMSEQTGGGTESALIDALIVVSGYSLTFLSRPSDGHSGISGEAETEQSVFSPLGVAVIQAFHTYYELEDWKKSLAGIDSMMLSTNVFQPEFDGQIIGGIFSVSKTIMTPYGNKIVLQAVPDRAARIAQLAVNWAKLKRKPMKERKIALILHCMPPRADCIGAVYGLDSMASAVNMTQWLKDEGLRTGLAFDASRDLAEAITSQLTNDMRFLPPGEAADRAAALIGPQVYGPWFDALPEKNREELLRDWGEAPGRVMASGREILIPGLLDGNLYIGLQPPRSFEEKAEEAYHSTDIVCPWQYVAFYRYLRDVFSADAIVHIGTHGTLEWLPGKEIGLSEECWPDAVLGTVPHVYPYIIDVPGEGAQAKRRSHAVILDHLIPAMKQAGVYGVLETLDGRISQYMKAVGLGGADTDELLNLIWEAVLEGNLENDLSITEEMFSASPAEMVMKIHLYISGIKTSRIRDGLHVFGSPPPGELYAMMLELLVQVPNGDVPSLRQGVAAAWGLNANALLDNPQGMNEDAGTNAMLIDEVDCGAREAVKILEAGGFNEEAVRDAAAAIIREEGSSQALLDCLRFLAFDVHPRLLRTADEKTNFLKALAGQFVPPGPSGAPSRGGAKLLPTGRNFYMVDPSAIPSRVSLATGRRLAGQMLDRYREENGGEWPESIAIIVYSGETITTGGDDIAEVLDLYSVRPVYLEGTDKVTGLEIIDAGELGRPRIDVTLRISGLFRDMFPNLIERIEDAVNMVASLDEDDSINFIKKHVREEVADLTRQGIDAMEAVRLSKLRVFGCPPGTYGAGVDILINSGEWKSPEDLGKAYVNWSAHAYGRNIHGEKLEDVFNRRLSITDVTIKNISSSEHDMLGDDDYYNYHGGLIAASRAAGAKPASYSTDATDVERVVTRSVKEDAARIVRMRSLNPQWIEGLKRHGFRGAGEISAMTDFIFGWDATADIIEDWMYEGLAETYLFDEENSQWMKEVNPWAIHAMAGRLLEAEGRGMWNASPETLEKLKAIFLESEGFMESC